MTDTKHTPTPWKCTSNDIWHGTNVISMISGECTAEQDEANAAHIVKCVNLHDELVEALKLVKAVYDQGLSGYQVERSFLQIDEALKKAGAM